MIMRTAFDKKIAYLTVSYFAQQSGFVVEDTAVTTYLEIIAGVNFLRENRSKKSYPLSM